MAKPIRIELEFTGWQAARIMHDEAETVMRPPTAHEMAKIIAGDIARKFEESHATGNLKIKVKPL